MLILDIKDVKPCSVIRREEKKQKTYPGLTYAGKLFIQVGSYPVNQSKIAFKQCRQLLQEDDGSSTTIVVKTNEKTTVWFHNKQLSIENDRSINKQTNYWKKAVFAVFLLL